MNVNGIGTTNYPAWYKTKNTTRQAAGMDLGGQARRTQQPAQTAQPTLVLHGKNDADEGETVVGSSVNALTGVSMAVYKPRDFDAANPVYHVKMWGADGNMTERMVDISKINLENCDEIDMSAYAWHLSNSGQCPNAFLKFAGVRSYYQTEQQKYDAGNVLEKTDWVEIIRDFMQMQYDAHNMKGYLDYKKLLGFMEQAGR